MHMVNSLDTRYFGNNLVPQIGNVKPVGRTFQQDMRTSFDQYPCTAQNEKGDRNRQDRIN